jgi:hypothetical protein
MTRPRRMQTPSIRPPSTCQPKIGSIGTLHPGSSPSRAVGRLSGTVKPSRPTASQQLRTSGSGCIHLLIQLTGTTLSNVATTYRIGPELSNLWLYRPWAPNRRRLWGFGRTSPSRFAGHDSPSHHVILHFAWTYLAPTDRHTATLVCPYWHLYHRLRLQAAVTLLAPL